eukprot:359833-Chlamydomonas_euryale.AAC.16
MTHASSGSLTSLPQQVVTVSGQFGSEDADTAQAVTGLQDEADELEHHLDVARSLPASPDPAGTPCRTLLVRGVAREADDDELASIFNVRSCVACGRFAHCFRAGACMNAIDKSVQGDLHDEGQSSVAGPTDEAAHVRGLCGSDVEA